MNKPRLTIFIRILLASLAPLIVLVFLYMDMPLGPLYRRVTGSMKLIAAVAAGGLSLLCASIFLTTRRKMLEQLNENHELKLKAVEEECLRKQVEAESEAKTRFFANMSHEIRTPMNAILGISEILLTEPLNERQMKFVSDVKVSAEALLAIINDILDMSKMETGHLSLVSVNYDFRLMLQNLCSIGSFLAAKKGILFESEESLDLPECLYGDDVRLRQILLNILSNAVKFTNDGRVTLKTSATDLELRFEVEDSGIGIKPEDKDYIFDMFSQADAEKNRHIIGTGLGLSISRNLARAMGGDIEVSSVYGEGSTFVITIPRVDGDDSEIAGTDDIAANFSAPEARVLIVDDNEINLSVAEGMIGYYDIECDTVLSGREAIEKISGNSYDIVFMDHMMPEMDGIETSRRIRALDGEGSKVPIVALSANAVIGMKEIFLASGMNDFVSKPIEKNRLRAALLMWLPKEKIMR
ncbi:MAG: response regulator [Synergistaceae bacterium]|jgi:signal transduction histidine kinase/ActR/RegA family two-component response regulator|nr:response regulator [Synergistaceae bacterium]